MAWYRTLKHTIVMRLMKSMGTSTTRAVSRCVLSLLLADAGGKRVSCFSGSGLVIIEVSVTQDRSQLAFEFKPSNFYLQQ